VATPEQTATSGSQSHAGRGTGSSPAITGKVSLANLLTNFMGEPLAATGFYDDVQLIFYPFNSYAGMARYLNIANFEIDLDFFTEKYTEYRLQNVSRSGNLTIRQFWTFLVSNIIDDPSAPSYGLRDNNGAIYRRTLERGERAEATRVVQPTDSDASTTINRLNNLLANVTPDGSFKTPQLNFTLECLPGRIASETAARDATNEKTILRVHIYDTVASSYEGLGAILAAQRNGALSIGQTRHEQGYGESLTGLAARRYYEQILTRANETGLVTRTENGTYEIVGGSNAIKQFLYQTTPYIIHGAKNSLIKQANLSSMTDQAANTLNMLRAPRGGSGVEPNGEDIGGIPMQVLPVELSIETFGCPLLQFSSQYFIDFNTGTTADTLYAINGIEHSISPGEFKSNVKFIAQDSYGQYRNYIQELNNAARACEDIAERLGPTPAAQTTTTASGTARGPGNRRRPRALTATQIEQRAHMRAMADMQGSVARLPGRLITELDIIGNTQLQTIYQQYLFAARERLRSTEAQGRATIATTERRAVEGRASGERQIADIQRQASGQAVRPPVSQELNDQQITEMATTMAQAGQNPFQMQMPTPPSPISVDAATGRTIDPRLAQSIAGSATASAAGAPRAAGTPRNRTT
jgi:hypothetical protein